MPIDGLARTAQPPRIGDVSVAAERYDLPGYRSVALVAERAADADFAVRVFGSWLWFWLSGEGNEAFVTAESDLDLVIDVAGECEAVAACRLLGSCQQELDGRGDGAIVIDAELAIAGIGDMHWRELVGSSDAVLVKSVAGPRMIPRDQLWR